MPPCSNDESLDDVVDRLRAERYAVDVEELASRPSAGPVLGAYAALAAIAALLVYPAPLVAAVLAGAAIVLHARESEGRPLVRHRSCTSRNVVARSPVPSRPELVVVASGLEVAPRFPEGVTRALRVALQAAMLVVAAAGAAAWVAQATTELPGALAAGGAVVAVVVGTLAAVVHGPRREARPLGEHPGLEVLVQLAPLLRDDPVWLVVTGSTTGMAAFLDAHPEAAGVHWLNLSSGEVEAVRAVSEEGTWRERRANRFLMGAAEEAGAEVAPYRAAPTNGTVLLARRRRALTLIVGEPVEGLRVALATARAALSREAPG